MAIHPPDEQRLIRVAHQQLEARASGTDDDDADNEGEGSGSDKPQRTHHGSKLNSDVKPNCLKYYEGSWHEALKMAKIEFRRYITIYNGFPTREEHLPDAAQIIARIVEDMKDSEEGVVVFDPGTGFYLFSYMLCLYISAIQQTRAMNCLVSIIFFSKCF